MTRIVTVLTEGFSDWETGLLNGVARGFYNIDTQHAAPGGKAVTSMGNLRVAPQLAMEAIDMAGFDAVVLCGGPAWKEDGAPDISQIVQSAVEHDRIIAAICDGTWGLAKTGFLDDRRHTSNGADYLTPSGYSGDKHYVDVPDAVTDGRLITAPGTAPVRFMQEIMRALGHGSEELDFFIGLHAAQFSPR